METDPCQPGDPASALDNKTEPPAQIQILVVFGNSWSYQFRFKRLKKQLNDIFPRRLVFVEERLPQSSEDFEVFVAGKLVHSKKGGDGYLDGYFNESKLVKVVAQIQEVLKDL